MDPVICKNFTFASCDNSTIEVPVGGAAGSVYTGLYHGMAYQQQPQQHQHASDFEFGPMDVELDVILVRAISTHIAPTAPYVCL